MNSINDARREYAEIIDLEHPVSKKHKPMSRANRAAQFAPFAALTGYEDLIRESERETEAELLLDEDGKAELNDKLMWLFSQENPPEAAFTVYDPDGKKRGGRYITITGRVSRYDGYGQSITLENGEVVFADAITKIECDGFEMI